MGSVHRKGKKRPVFGLERRAGEIPSQKGLTNDLGGSCFARLTCTGRCQRCREKCMGKTTLDGTSVPVDVHKGGWRWMKEGEVRGEGWF